jgi:hypothetical protein
MNKVIFYLNIGCVEIQFSEISEIFPQRIQHSIFPFWINFQYAHNITKIFNM